ncbi:MORN repeat-containing protein 1 [Oopsacas minuta]|uniref:MORN repeat-containing protein 1 n=1 Tax=Oopsacas minuta TaxID=111878 RepID=A0AAV7JLD4_9METZ|nr:MORN repeat-containing protein 1 [Oopsacas minuta]
MSGIGRYEGQTKSQARHGVGVYYYPNKFFKYEGEWREGKKHGTGKLILGDGGYYEGAFYEGEIEGNGERLYGHSGAKYVGHFSKGERDGLGRYEESDGSYYEGNWCYNKKEGFGSSLQVDGSFYEGEWHNNVKHGEGMQRGTDGVKYEGGWINGQRHGHGKFVMSDKSLYEGQFKNGVFHGQGTLRHSSGIVRICPWVKGEPFSQPVAFVFQFKKNVSFDHGKPFTLNVVVVDKNGNTFEEENGRKIELRVSRMGKIGENVSERNWMNLLVRKSSDSDNITHTSRSTPVIPFSSQASIDESDSPFKILEPAQTVKGFVCFKNVYLPTFPADLKDKAFNKLNNAKPLKDKVMIFDNTTQSDGEEASGSFSLSETNLLRNKTKGKRVGILKSQSRGNSIETEDQNRDSAPLSTVDGTKTPTFGLSEDLTIAAIDVTDNPFPIRIPTKHLPVYIVIPTKTLK